MRSGDIVATRRIEGRESGDDAGGERAEDTVLARRAAGGDRAAFDALYHRHSARVYGVCLRMVADVARSERLTQDAFVLAWRRMSTFREESAFTSWLHRIAVNVVLQDARTTKRREKRVEPTAEPARLDTTAKQEPHELRVELERAVAALPPRAREVLVLHDIEGYTHAEIARITGTAVGTTKAQLHRARQLLRERLNR